MTYVMSKQQYRTFKHEHKLNDQQILDEINRCRGLRGEFAQFVIQG